MGKDICDYKIADGCDGTLKGRNGTPHKVWTSPQDALDGKPPVTRYACIDCEMCFDED